MADTITPTEQAYLDTLVSEGRALQDRLQHYVQHLARVHQLGPQDQIGFDGTITRATPAPAPVPDPEPALA